MTRDDKPDIDWAQVIQTDREWITQHRGTTERDTEKLFDGLPDDPEPDGNRKYCKRGHPLFGPNLKTKTWHTTGGEAKTQRECRECVRIRLLADKLERNPRATFKTKTDRQAAQDYLAERIARRKRKKQQ